MSAVRRILWAAGLPARTALIAAIKLYRLALSGLLGGQCRFYPSCSVYAEKAVRCRGAVVGATLATWRVLRCNPFGKGGAEPVPMKQDSAARLRVPAYDVVLHASNKEVSA